MQSESVKKISTLINGHSSRQTRRIAVRLKFHTTVTIATIAQNVDQPLQPVDFISFQRPLRVIKNMLVRTWNQINATVCLIESGFHMIAMGDVHMTLLIRSIVDIELIEVYLSDDDRHDS